jgi:hypothetical protein
MIWERIFNPNVSLKARSAQVANAILTPVLARSLRLTHVVEYPKSGGSWIRTMIRNYLGSEAYLHDRLLFRDAVIHTHRLYRRSFHRTVVVVRDPRDIFVSFYHHETHYEDREKQLSIGKYFEHDPNCPVEEDFADYLEAKLLHASHPWFYYSQFLDAWLNRPAVCVVRYEDFLKEPQTQLIRVIRFLNRPLSLEKIQEAVELNSFDYQTKVRYGEARERGVADNSKFLRKGVAGDWKNHFNPRSCELLEQVEGPSLRRLGYEDDAGWIERFLENGS